jgi:uncharacterized protein YndB with AHSA1/START domain
MSEHGVLVDRRTVRFERLLPGPIERVWAYLTESEKRATWLAAGEMELAVGGRVEHVFHNSRLTGHDDPPPPKYEKYGGESRMAGTITACEPPRRLAYTWPESSGEPSEVTFELAPRGERVLLVLTHRRLASREDVLGVSGGWHAHLDILADRLEGRRPPSFWPTHTRLEAEYERRIPAD